MLSSTPIATGPPHEPASLHAVVDRRLPPRYAAPRESAARGSHGRCAQQGNAQQGGVEGFGGRVRSVRQLWSAVLRTRWRPTDKGSHHADLPRWLRLHRKSAASLPPLQFVGLRWRPAQLGSAWLGQSIHFPSSLRVVRSMTTSPGKAGRVRYDWWRAHHGLPSHAKWRAVARAAQVPVSVAFHIVVCLLDAASRGNPRGSIGAFKPFDCAGIVDVPLDKVDRVVEVLREVHWLEGHMVAEWDGRQPQREDAHAARRAAEYRSRSASVTNEKVTHQKRDVAVPSRSERVTKPTVTLANAPDRDKERISSEYGTARARPAEPPDQQDNSAGSLATALGGALTRPPDAEPAATEPKPPSEVKREEFEAIFAARRRASTEKKKEEPAEGRLE
jgi:hypothetical protein